MLLDSFYLFFFFFNDTATTEIYTLSLHDALPILRIVHSADPVPFGFTVYVHVKVWRSTAPFTLMVRVPSARADRKSTRLNSSHLVISYAVFCLKKKTNTQSSY